MGACQERIRMGD